MTRDGWPVLSPHRQVAGWGTGSIPLPGEQAELVEEGCEGDEGWKGLGALELVRRGSKRGGAGLSCAEAVLPMNVSELPEDRPQGSQLGLWNRSGRSS